MNHLIDEYFHMPPVTRTYLTLCSVTTLAVQLDLVTPFQLYYNPSLIFRNYQFWRLITSFCYFGSLGINFLFNMIFTYRHCRSLEENSFQGKTADFLFMLLFGAAITAFIGTFVNMVFLGHALTIMIVYVWSRRNPFVRMNFFGMFNFSAPYLPWVLLAFSVLLGNSVVVDIVGISVGHVYYFLEDVFPLQRNGFRILKTPWILAAPNVGPGGSQFDNAGPSSSPQGYSGNKKMQQAQAQVDEVVDIMKLNVDRVLERDQKLSQLDNRAEELEVQSRQFQTTATRVKRKYFWKNIKMWIILIAVIAVILIGIIIWIVVSVKNQGDNNPKPPPPTTIAPVTSKGR